MNNYPIKKYINNNFARTARDFGSWHRKADMNLCVANMFRNKYLKAHKDNEKWMLNIAKGKNLDKKFPQRILFNMDLGKYALMFYGITIECYLKAIIVKNGFDPIKYDNSDNPQLKKDFLKHNVSYYIDSAFKKRPTLITGVNRPYLDKIERAITAAKYPIEKNVKTIFAYTGDFDKTVNFSKKFIEILKTEVNRH